MIAEIERYQVFEGDASADWINRMTGVNHIDSGEAEILARVADGPHLFMASGDKRCLAQLKNVPGLIKALGERIVTLEGALIHLCQLKGPAFIRALITPKAHVDGMAKIVFTHNATDQSVMEGLWSYHKWLIQETGIQLWPPTTG